jgi:hypothetical protein
LGASTKVSPRSINAAGEICGEYEDASSGTRGFVRRKNGIFETFEVPSSNATFPIAINNKGEIAGSYSASGQADEHVFLRHANGTVVNVDVQEGPKLSAKATGMNNKGDVVGYYLVSGDTNSAAGTNPK